MIRPNWLEDHWFEDT